MSPDRPPPPADPADPYAGKRLGGRYEVLFRLGADADGIVYAARDREADRKVAVKLLPGRDAEAAASPETRLTAARRLGSADDRVCEVSGAGVADDGTPFLVLELIAGRPLSRLLAEPGRIAPVRALDLGWQLASALEAAHALGVVHGAVAPAAVWLAGEAGAERVKVVDFGGARTGAATGTAPSGYQAPEVLLGRDVDARAEIYAVGVILYELLAGVHPYAGLEGDHLVEAVLHVDPEPVERIRAEVGPVLAAVVAKAMAREAAQRFGSMAQLAAALADLRPAARLAPPAAARGAGVTGAAAPRPPPPRARRASGRLATGVAAAAVLVGAGALFLARSRGVAPPAVTAPAPAPASAPAPPAAAPAPEATAAPEASAAAPAGASAAPAAGEATLAAPAPAGAPATAIAAGDAQRAGSAAARAEERPAAVVVPLPSAERPAPRAPSGSAAPPAARQAPSTRVAAAPKLPAPAPAPARAAAVPAAGLATSAASYVAEPHGAAGASLAAGPAPAPAAAPPRVSPPAVPVERAPAPAEAPRPAAPEGPATLDPATLQALVREHRSAIDGCIAEDPTVGGRLLLAVRARGDGSFAAVTPQSGGSKVVQRCIVRLFQRWRVAAPGREASGAVTIELD